MTLAGTRVESLAVMVVTGCSFVKDVKDALQERKVKLCLRVRARAKRLCPAEARGS